MPERRHLLGAVAVLSLVALAASCGGSRGLPTGSALDGGIYMGSRVAFKPLAPGWEVGMQDPTVENTLDQPVTLISASIGGSGFGPVIRVVSMQAAPVDTSADTTDGGAFDVNPPVYYAQPSWRVPHDCSIQALRPIEGFVLKPHADVRIWEVFEGLGPGNYDTPGTTITYEAGGTTYQELITFSLYGTVEVHAPDVPEDGDVVPCLAFTHLMPGATGRPFAS